MENVIDLIANTGLIYIVHCSNCKNKFTSLVYKTYLNTKHSDRNAKEIKYIFCIFFKAFQFMRASLNELRQSYSEGFLLSFEIH